MVIVNYHLRTQRRNITMKPTSNMDVEYYKRKSGEYLCIFSSFTLILAIDMTFCINVVELGLNRTFSVTFNLM